MRGVNKVFLIGNLGKDPEVKRLESGAMVATFSLATTEVYKDKTGNRSEKVEWHNIAVWNKQAEIAEKYLRKGSAIFLEGSITSREYTDKDNIKRRFYEIRCERFNMLDKKPDGIQATPGASGNDIVGDEPLDDLPF